MPLIDEISIHHMGQIAGQPLWQLLGGRGSRVPLYASTGERRPIPERVAAARALQAQGFGAIKLRFHAADPRSDVAVVRAVRGRLRMLLQPGRRALHFDLDGKWPFGKWPFGPRVDPDAIRPRCQGDMRQRGGIGAAKQHGQPV